MSNSELHAVIDMLGARLMHMVKNRNDEAGGARESNASSTKHGKRFGAVPCTRSVFSGFGAILIVLAAVTIGCQSGQHEQLLIEKVGLDSSGSVSRESFETSTLPVDSVVGVSITATHSMEMRVEVVDSNGKLLLEARPEASEWGRILDPLEHQGTLTIAIEAQQLGGRYSLTAGLVPEASSLWPYQLTGPLMICVCLLFVFWWLRRSKTRLRWFLVGAAAWAVGVIPKALIAAFTMDGLVAFVVERLPDVLATTVVVLYSGLMTGIFELGAMLGIVLIWRKVAAEPNRATAIGIGAGAFEALLIGIAAAIAAATLYIDHVGVETLKVGYAVADVTTPLVWLVGIVERIFTVPIHTATRLLVLLAIAKGRRGLIAPAFLIFTLVDGYAGWLHHTDTMGTANLWICELPIFVFGLASAGLAMWAYKKW